MTATYVKWRSLPFLSGEIPRHDLARPCVGFAFAARAIPSVSQRLKTGSDSLVATSSF